MNSGPPAVISVVIPTFNLEDVVEQTLQSVLDQTSLPDEMLLIDDGSTDRTVERIKKVIAREPEGLIRLFEAPHLGPGAARNCGVQEAKGNWIAFLDGDDLWLPEKMSRLREVISAHPDATFIAHDNVERSLDGKEIRHRLHSRYDSMSHLLPQLYRANFLATSSVAVRKDAVCAVGGFDPSLAVAQDYDLWLKLARSHRLFFIPDAMERYVRRRGSISCKVLQRYRCVIRIAYRHAPFLVPIVGWRRAFLLRFRLVAIAHYLALSQVISTENLHELMAVLLRSPGEVLCALIRPIESAKWYD